MLWLFDHLCHVVLTVQRPSLEVHRIVITWKLIMCPWKILACYVCATHLFIGFGEGRIATRTKINLHFLSFCLLFFYVLELFISIKILRSSLINRHLNVFRWPVSARNLRVYLRSEINLTKTHFRIYWALTQHYSLNIVFSV